MGAGAGAGAVRETDALVKNSATGNVRPTLACMWFMRWLFGYRHKLLCPNCTLLIIVSVRFCFVRYIVSYLYII